MTGWKRKRKIATMPNVPVDASTVLGRTLEKANEGAIKAVYVGIQFKDGTFAADWSAMSNGELGLHARLAGRIADANFFKT